ncbi:PREDICTED: coiled-coil domain-containing protein 96 [Crocodylus porosus]|uniref:coiled-coil domain-containing protein 96 n=1 Tax=Crocodylus porosus TaxID=8502 RepID=UPI00093D4DA5|nr:PREDICTED: coiled-coil domain-containing protein 96 [Crocodylus porosus]
METGEAVAESWGAMEEPEEPEEVEEEEEGEAEAASPEAGSAAEVRRRAELMEEYRALLAERERLRQATARQQFRLRELLLQRGKRPDEPPRTEPDAEERYARCLAALHDLRALRTQEAALAERRQAVRESACEEGGERAELERLQAAEQRKDEMISQVRLENIKLKHKIEQLEARLKTQEELAEGLHLIDFEQLKIENQTYNEKVDERNEELLKLRKKVTTTVQVLTQLKEKLQFVEAENQEKKVELLQIEAVLAQKRDVLTKTKQARDRLRADNQRLQQKCGLLGNEVLLQDFENKVDAAQVLNQRLENLKQHHAGLTIACKGIKKKIEEAKSFLSP